MNSKIDNLKIALENQMNALANCKPEDIDQEVQRSKAIGGIGTIIVSIFKAEVDLYCILPTETKHQLTNSMITLNIPAKPEEK